LRIGGVGSVPFNPNPPPQPSKPPPLIPPRHPTAPKPSTAAPTPHNPGPPPNPRQPPTKPQPPPPPRRPANPSHHALAHLCPPLVQHKAVGQDLPVRRAPRGGHRRQQAGLEPTWGGPARAARGFGELFGGGGHWAVGRGLCALTRAKRKQAEPTQEDPRSSGSDKTGDRTRRRPNRPNEGKGTVSPLTSKKTETGIFGCDRRNSAHRKVSTSTSFFRQKTHKERVHLPTPVLV
jgi:hypothetical protein